MPEYPIEKRLAEVLEKRKQEGSLRTLKLTGGLVDFYSNDYLGFSRSLELDDLFVQQWQQFHDTNLRKHGSTGSRLLSGNSELAEEIEYTLQTFHDAPAALLFNSGYDANIGMISAFIRPGDVVFYDELVHASMHDGMKLARIKGIPFQHNDMDHLEALLAHTKGESIDFQKFILVETIYSMDGDPAPLAEICELAEKYGANIIADEAHATGIFGPKGQGLCYELGLQNRIFARLITFSKALGNHGAAVLTSPLGKQYLINFARSFIYSTAASLTSLLEIKSAYELLNSHPDYPQQAQKTIQTFKNLMETHAHLPFLKGSSSMIQGLLLPGNHEVRKLCAKLLDSGFDLRPLVFPTVPKGKERIRICLHTFNSTTEMEGLVELIDRNLP